MNKFSLGLLLVLGGTLGIVAKAYAAPAGADGVALCVGCTTRAQFAAAAKQAAGTRFNGTKRFLVVNPDSGLSKWVTVTNTPAGQEPLDVPSSRMQYGVAVPIQSNPFANVYVAGDNRVEVDNGGGGTSTQVAPLTTLQQLGVNTVIQVTKNKYVVTLDPSKFPSYEGTAAGTAKLANADYQALVSATDGHWPVSVFTEDLLDDLKKALHIYTGDEDSPKVCNIFANGDAVCLTPVPNESNVCHQDGSAVDQSSASLPDICNRAAGGGSGMSVSPGTTPGEFEYMGSASIVWVDCYWSNGSFEGCYKEAE